MNFALIIVYLKSTPAPTAIAAAVARSAVFWFTFESWKDAQLFSNVKGDLKLDARQITIVLTPSGQVEGRP